MASRSRLLAPIEGQGWVKARLSFQKTLIKAGKAVSEMAINEFTNGSAEFLREVGAQFDRNGPIPYFTGNLMDSIGVRILYGNTIRAIRTMDDEGLLHAEEPQRMNGQNNIWGYIEAFRRLNRPSHRVRQSVAAQLVVAVPYAQEVDWTHHFTPELREKFGEKMESCAQKIKNYKFIADYD